MVWKYVNNASFQQRGFYGLCNAPVAVNDPQWQSQASVLSAYLQIQTTESCIL